VHFLKHELEIVRIEDGSQIDPSDEQAIKAAAPRTEI
jgi:hypothetical protein